VPAEKTAAHTPMPTARCLGSTNISRINPNVEGINVAPARPNKARVAISIAALVDKAASTEAPPNAAAPTRSNRRRPIRSPRVPIVISDPAMRNP
jgi:hypothetical protein